MYKIALPALNPNSIDLLINELKKTTGMEFDHYQRNFLEKRIYYRMKHLSIDQYEHYINYIHSNPDEIDLFLDKFTINYTYFFRNYKVFESFEKFLKIYVKDLKRPLKIWSAPCATGDEPYTIAMMLDQFKNSVKDFPDFKIFASDIDRNALEIAKNGIYGEYAVHETPKMLINTYFSKLDTNLGLKYLLDKKIREKVTFFQEDIIQGHQSNEKYDVIFCRNFIIYINQYAREKLMRILESRLINGGLLVLGGSESFSPQNTCFESINIRDRFYIKNLSSLDEDYRKKIYNSFQSKRAKDKRKRTDVSKSKTGSFAPNKRELVEKGNLAKTKKVILERAIKIEQIGTPIELEEIKDKNNIKKTQIKKQDHSILNPIEGAIIKNTQQTEVRITDIVVNNGFKSNSPENKKDSINLFSLSPIERNKSFQNEKSTAELAKRERELNSRDLLLKKKEETLQQISISLEKEKEDLDNQWKKMRVFLQNTLDKERDINNKAQTLERFEKRLDKREQVIEQKERQLQDRLNQIGQFSRQVIQREIQININSKEIETKEGGPEDIPPFEEKRYDLIEKANSKKEYIIPMGYYGLINSFDRTIDGTKFSIQGLGSSIALILKDPINNIFAMSHISLPDSSASKQGYHLLFPHTFADTSVKDLYNTLIYNGADESNIRAIIVGGAKLFLDYDMTYQENLDAVKKELHSLEIDIEVEDIGGLSERSVVYDTINDALYVRKSWEFQYRKIHANT